MRAKNRIVPGLAVNRPEQGPRKTETADLLAIAALGEVFGCFNPSGPEYPCSILPRGQWLSHLYKRRGGSSQKCERGEKS
jgi:hypothetical protein